MPRQKPEPKPIRWKTVQVKVQDLRPFHENPQGQTQKEKQDLDASLTKFDLGEIPACDTDKTVLAGHKRIAWLIEQGRGEEVIDVRMPLRKFTPDEQREYLIRSNKNRGHWDNDMLAGGGFEFRDLIKWGFTKQELEKRFDLRFEDETSGDSPPDDIQFGAATSTYRHSAPIKFWMAQKLLRGQVLDFGSGRESHKWPKFDAFTAPDYSLLLRPWDTVMSNYVLNVQPTAHTVRQILVILALITKPEGRTLIAVRNDIKPGSSRSDRGWQVGREQSEWEALFDGILEIEMQEKNQTFMGWVCRRKELET